jgi:hypothetical protein
METTSPPTAETMPPRLRWYRPRPGHLLFVLLLAEGLLLLSDRFGCWHKGYAVLVAIASIGLTILVLLLWFALALLRRWQFQFSIRSLLALTVVVAIACSWLAVEMKRAREQSEVVATIYTLGGAILYDHQPFTATKVPPGPAWLCTLIGDDFFGNVTAVNLVGTQIKDADLKCLNGLPQLEWLLLDKKDITNVALEHLSGLIQLRSLWLNEATESDEAVKKLQQGLPKCEIVF